MKYLYEISIDPPVHYVSRDALADAVSPDGQWLVILRHNRHGAQELLLAEALTRTVAHVFNWGAATISAVSFDPLALRLAVGAGDGTVRVLDVETRSEVWSIAAHQDRILVITWSLAGQRLALLSRDGTATVFDANNGRLQGRFRPTNTRPNGVAFSQPSGHLVLSSDDGCLHMWRHPKSCDDNDIPPLVNPVSRLQRLDSLAVATDHL
jgi:WD40 repeat protein